MENVSLITCPVCKSNHVPKENKQTAGVFAASCENCGHFFKYRASVPYKTSVSFTVNGVSYTAGNEFGPSTSLAEFLREKRISMGTKIMCRQGGCGVCIVEAKMQLSAAHPKVSAALNSCLCPLFLCDGWEITTVEGLGSTRTSLHTIQSNLADFMGSQCGYCSPGQIMNMYGLTQKYPNLTKQFVEDHFEGNLCRCTGYRPILDAFKAMVPTVSTDIEDLSTKLCVNNPTKACDNNGQCGGKCSANTTGMPVRMVFDSIQWFKAVDYADLLNMLQQYSGKKIRLMGANTGTGAFYSQENVGNYEVVIDISAVSEFFTNSYDSSTQTFTLGSNVTLSDMIDLFTKEAAKAGNVGSFNELKKYLYRVASSPIRNRATWAGNMMLKNHIPTFPSDIFNIFTVLNASLVIGSSPHDIVTPDAFFTTDMTGKAISKVTFKNIPSTDIVACFKVIPRSQNSLALVNGAFRCTVSPNYIVSGQPVISIGGISGTFHRASRTEAYLAGKQLSSQQTLAGALGILTNELVPSNDIHLPSPAYRKLVACSLLYKYFLHVLGHNVSAKYRSGSTVLHDVRPLSSGTQSYDTKKIEWPLNEPLKKLEANIQCTGEAEFTDDTAPLPGQLFASFVTSTKANASIQNIDTSAVVGMPGVFKVLTAADIPAGGKNDITALPPAPYVEEYYVELRATMVPQITPREALASGQVHYYGQPIAVVLADSQETADEAAFMVQVTYTNIQPPILTLNDAIQKQSTFPTPFLPPVIVGNPQQAMAMSPCVTSGAFYLHPQYHFYFETMNCVVIPTDEGLLVKASTQWLEGIQHVVAQICGIPKNKVTVEVKRVGGGFGGKITRAQINTSVCGLAAYLTNRPVRMKMPLWTNMEVAGKRNAYKADYQVGHDTDGKISAIIVKYYSDYGYVGNENNRLLILRNYMDNAYSCPNWDARVVACRTNKPPSCACRSPGSVPAIFIMEQMMEHIATTLNKDPTAIRRLNMYKQGQVTPIGMTLSHCNLEPVMNELMTSGQISARQQAIVTFNSENRWKKRSMSVVPMKWGVNVTWTYLSVLINIHADGSVLIHHGGIEMGQGINTKVAQVCAYQLGIPITMVTVRGTNTIVEANNVPTGGSVTSECCSQGVITCCTKIKARMAPVKAKMAHPTWSELVSKCITERVSLSERVDNVPTHPLPFEYNSYGATCSEVELDVLTGEYQINRVDIVYDCGESLNPAIDIGQVEGGFIMGLGYSTSEEIKYDASNGQNITNDTWSYHPPTNKDIPIDFRVSLLKNRPNPSGVLRSKLVGEPPVCMSCSVFFALRKCVEEARKDAGHTEYFDFYPPATVEKVQTACLVNIAQFRLQ